MGTFTINAAATGFAGDAPLGLAIGYPLEYHSQGGGYGGYYPNTWISSFQGAFLALSGTTTASFNNDGGAPFSMTVNSGTFYVPVYDTNGNYTGNQAIGTATLPSFSYSGVGIWQGSGSNFSYDLYVGNDVFGNFMKSQDLRFNGSEVRDFLDGSFLSGAGHDAVFYGNGGDDIIFGSYLANNSLYGGSGKDQLTVYAFDYEEDQGPLHSVSVNVIDGGADDDDLYFYGNYPDAEDKVTIHGGDGNDRISASYGSGVVWGDGGDDEIGVGTEHIVAFSGKHTEYSISGTGQSSFSVEDRRAASPDGTDAISGATRLQFADGIFNVSDLLGIGVTVTGTSGADIIKPTKAPAGQPKPSDLIDTIYGLGGNDRLDGGLGADVMYGGAGNDIYTVDNAGDRAVEINPGTGTDDGGTDLVNASASFTLEARVENLTLVEVGGQIDGIGNDIANKIIGNSFRNTLVGHDGADTLTGNAGEDTLDGGTGNDTLSGGADNDFLSGGDGIDKLDGGLGADWMFGGAGNDTYTVDDLGDQVSELDDNGNDAGGIDLVNASVTFLLGDFVENLTLTGAAAIDGSGNALANRIVGNNASNTLNGGGGNDALTGNGGNDTLNGDAGNDTLLGGAGIDTLKGGEGVDRLDGGTENDALTGGAGLDTLTGGAGSDTFWFDGALASSKDKITDFASGIDHLSFTAATYGLSVGNGLTSSGGLDANWFEASASATKSHSEFLYNASTKTLMWDPNGAGGAAAIAIATFDNGVAPHVGDFVFV